MVESENLGLFRVAPDTKVRLATYDPAWVGDEQMRMLGEEKARQRALEMLEKERGVLAEMQARLYASDVYAVLVILQGMAGADLDEVVKHVMTGVNPQGCQVHKFLEPSAEEQDHDFLWRYTKALPERGRIGIFNRSYYDEVVAARVSPGSWKDRYKSINNFEDHLVSNGIVVLKLFLNISKVEQKKRLLEMIDDPAQCWQFTGSELLERKAWEQYVEAYQEAMSATSTERAPWYVIPADHRWVANALVADLLTDVILELGVDFPKVDEGKKKELEEARVKLEGDD